MLYLFTALESSMLFFLCGSLLDYRYEKKKRYTVSAVVFIGLTLLLILIASLPLVIKTLLSLFFTLAAYLIIFNSKWYISFFFIILGYYELAICDIIAANLISFMSNENLLTIIDNESLIYICLGIGSKLVAGLLIYISIHFFNKVSFSVPLKYWMIMTFVVSLFFYITMSFSGLNIIYTENGGNSLKTFFIALCYVAVNFLVLFFFGEVCNYYTKEVQMSLTKLKNDFLEHQLEQRRYADEELHMLKHDIKNHLTSLAYYYERNDTQHFNDYLSSLIDKASVSPNIRFTGIQLFDAVLYIKKAEAQNNSINFEIVCPDNLPQIKIRECDLCSILANLLDNAIEASLRIPEADRKISIRINSLKNYFAVVIDNKFSGQLVTKKDMPVTTKQDKLSHGIGYKAVKGLAEAYDGVCEYTVNDNVFSVSILLPIEQSTEKQKSAQSV